MSVSDPEEPSREVADAAASVTTTVASAVGALVAGGGRVLATFAGWLGWDASAETERTRPEGPVALRAIPRRGGSEARSTEPAAARGGAAAVRQPATSDGPPPAPPGFPDEERDEITVLVRDPSSVFVFWTLAAATVQRRERLRLGAPRGMVGDALQVEAEGDGDAPGAETAASAWTVPLAPGAKSVHVDLLRPRRHARVTLGVLGEEIGFVPLVASDLASLPETREGAAAPPHWRRVGALSTEAEPPRAPSPEACALLAARAAESDTATSSTLPVARHVLALERGVGSATPAR